MRAKKEALVFDFESLYQTYPRREGRAMGMKKLNATIKTAAEFDLFKVAMENYIKQLVDRRTQPQFIKLWSTFCNNWRDYLEVVAIPHADPLDQLKRVMSGKL